MLTATEIVKVQKTLPPQRDDMPLLLGALSDASRYRIFRLLMEHEELCVTDVANILSLSPSAISQHFRILELAGFVEGERMGQMVCYRLRRSNPKTLSFINFFS